MTRRRSRWRSPRASTTCGRGCPGPRSSHCRSTSGAALITTWDREWHGGGDVVLGVFLDGTPIGGTGLHRRIGPEGLEIGYWIHADHTRRGYAAEVAAALTDAAFTVDGITRVEIHHDQGNVASQGVPRTLGYEYVTKNAVEAKAPSETGVNCVWVVTKDRWAGRSTTSRERVQHRIDEVRDERVVDRLTADERG